MCGVAGYRWETADSSLCKCGGWGVLLLGRDGPAGAETVAHGENRSTVFSRSSVTFSDQQEEEQV